MAKRLLAIIALLLMTGAVGRAAEKPLPIIFVHGNGDSAAVWTTTIWRFETNGYPSALLDAFDIENPMASARYDEKQPHHTTPEQAMRQLAAEVAAVKKRTGAAKLILIGHSRGANIIRDYLKNGGGAANTAIAILCGGVSHGVLVSDHLLKDSEFNGAAPFLRDLNSTPGEIVPGVRFLTIRSDGNDKYAQPDGRFLGDPTLVTGIGPDAPALKGATNIVLPGADHREVGFSAAAFGAMYKFITGHPPRTLSVFPEHQPVIAGKVTAFVDGVPTNIGVGGAVVEVYKVSTKTGERQGSAVLRQVTEEDGSWGPLKVEPRAHYEFILAVRGFPVTHIYRSSFPRSSRYVDLRPQPVAKQDAGAGAIVYVSRPRGYFGLGRDRILLDGKTPPGIPEGVPSVSAAHLAFPAEPRSLLAVFNRERIALRTWPLKEDEVSVAEFTW